MWELAFLSMWNNYWARRSLTCKLMHNEVRGSIHFLPDAAACVYASVCVCVSAHIITWKIETEGKTGAFPVYIGVRPHSSRTSVGRATHWSYCVNRTQYSLWCAQSLNCADGLLQLWEKPFNVKISFIELNANRWWFCINTILLCPLRWIIHLLHALCRIAVYGLSGVSYTWWTLPVSELLSNRLWFGWWLFVPAKRDRNNTFSLFPFL